MSVTTDLRAPDIAYVLFDVEVAALRRITPHMLRVTFRGDELDEMASAGRDQRVKLFFPRAGEDAPVVPVGRDWYPRYRALDPDTRPPVRTYTVRHFDPVARTVDIDFALHGDAGPASAWARRAERGDRVALLGPNTRHDPVIGWEFQPPAHARWTLLVGDETALPAIGAILDSLGGNDHVRAVVEVAAATELPRLDSAASVELTAVTRDGAPPGDPELLLGAVRAAQLPAGSPYVWLAGESAMVRAVRRHLNRDRDVPKQDIYFSGYWKRGSAIE